MEPWEKNPSLRTRSASQPREPPPLIFEAPHNMPVERHSVLHWIDMHTDWEPGQWVSGGVQGFLGKSPLTWRPEALDFVGMNDPKWEIPK